MKRLKTYVKMEIAVVAILLLSVLILQLFVRNQVDTFDEKMIEMRADLDEKEVQIADFTKITTESDIKVEMIKGSPRIVILSAPEVIENIGIQENSGWLKIVDKEDDLNIERELKDASVIQIYYDNINELQSDKNAYLSVLEILDNRKLDVETYGNSTIQVKVDSENVTAKSEGNSQLTLRGEADTVFISSHGNSTLRANACYVRVANAESNGNSTLRCQSDMEIQAHASGNSSLHVFGDPKVSRTSSSENARIRN